jgi:hypothetical protein
MNHEVKDDLAKLEKDVVQLGIDFEKSTPFAAWQFLSVEFPSAGMDVTIRHALRGPGQIIAVAVGWEFLTAPGTPPALYTIQGTTPQQAGYYKVRSTVAGKALVLLAIRRDNE